MGIEKDKFEIGGAILSSRLIMGTGKFSSAKVLKETLDRTDVDMVTVALRRVDLTNPDDNLLNAIDPEKYIILPNTSGAMNADEAVRLARLARASGISDWIKLEVTPDPKYLLPDGEETLKASQILVEEGFKVMPYINADPILAKKLEDVGTVSVMPLGAPIGSNQGLKTKEMIRIIIEQSNIPVIIDAGIGKPSHALDGMEMGADAVLVNTAIATAPNPIEMAYCFQEAVRVGRRAFVCGFPEQKCEAEASSSLSWISQLSH